MQLVQSRLRDIKENHKNLKFIGGGEIYVRLYCDLRINLKMSCNDIDNLTLDKLFFLADYINKVSEISM